MASRRSYTHAQLEAYFDRIALPADQRLHAAPAHRLPAAQQLARLGTIVKHHLVRVPFENLTLHYSWHRVVDVSPPHLYAKIVAPLHRAAGGTVDDNDDDDGGDGDGDDDDDDDEGLSRAAAASPPPPNARGGYCMENNVLLNTVLLSLGFTAYLAGARVHAAGGTYAGFSHCVNIVIVDGARYLVDVGWGGGCGPTRPLRLEHGTEHVHVAPPAGVRLVHEAIPQQVDPSCRVWIYQHRTRPDAAWTPQYCFAELEFLPEDIRGLNMTPSGSRTSFFTYKVICTRFTTRAERDGAEGPGQAAMEGISESEIDGALILFQDTLKWRRDGETKLEVKLGSEKQRIDALVRYFGIQFEEADREAIKGTVSELSQSREF
ncbi:arylamine N-acetyltransferase 3 [Xylariaceae sp. FL0016]|nr:arylamine N-acetyltransferase 3 [Xylariaceae sp. FL0016]